LRLKCPYRDRRSRSRKLERAIKNLLVTAAALLLSLAAAELVLQTLVKPSRLYSTLRSVPAANQWKNEVRFWERHQARKDSLVGGHDPLLGWEQNANRERLRGSQRSAKEPESTRIVAIGDSFTYGNEVADNENFAALLDADPGLQVFNMGVPGFGIGQAYLKYRHFGARRNPDVVLFGIYVDDYERTSMQFTSAAKPGFAVIDDQLAVLGQPVPTPDTELARIARSLDERTLIIDAVKNLWLKATTGAAAERAFFANTDRVVGKILSALSDSLSERQQLLIVHIPRAESFTDDADPFRLAMGERLLAIYARLGLRHVDLGAGFRNTASDREGFADYYVHRPGGSVGHLSPQGHRAAAALIRAALATADQPARSRSLSNIR